IRCIGSPDQRFAEDYLRLLRAVRFAARLNFEIEAQTRAAIRATAANLAKVAPERVREELERMLSHPSRRAAVEGLHQAGLVAHLWRGAQWSQARFARVSELLSRLPDDASFELSFAVLVSGVPAKELERICRDLAF